MTTAAPAKPFKITYTSANADMGEFHRLFDEGLAWAHAQMGREHPLFIDGKPVASKAKPIAAFSPIDGAPLGRFAAAQKPHLDAALAAARRAQ